MTAQHNSTHEVQIQTACPLYSVVQYCYAALRISLGGGGGGEANATYQN